MLEIRIHGRGGQGAVLASKILAIAYFYDDLVPQSFAQYGSERRGAPVAAFVRVDEKKLTLRCQIYNPDHVIILDESLLEISDPLNGLKEGGYVLINSKKSPSEFHFNNNYKIACVDGNEIAHAHELGSKTAPIVNTVILGAFAKINNSPKLESLKKAISEVISFDSEKNIKAALEAYNKVKSKK